MFDTIYYLKNFIPRKEECESFDFVSQFSHYENMSVQYAAISKSGKIDNCWRKKCYIFLIFAQNIDCGYKLEPRF